LQRQFKFSLANDQNKVPDALLSLDSWLDASKIPTSTRSDVQIVLGEALNNVIEHGFEGNGGGAINLMVHCANGKVTAVLEDNGREFMPPNITKTPVDVTGNQLALPEGGFGWFLIYQITDSFNFERRKNKNNLHLNFRN